MKRLRRTGVLSADMTPGRTDRKLVAIATGVILGTFAATQAFAQEMEMPFGTQADAEYAALIWEAMHAARLAGPGMIHHTPYEGTDPHGMHSQRPNPIGAPMRPVRTAHQGWAPRASAPPKAANAMTSAVTPRARAVEVGWNVMRCLLWG